MDNFYESDLEMHQSWNLFLITSMSVLLSPLGSLEAYTSKPPMVTVAAIYISADIGPTKLETMITKSDCIVVAKVTEIISVQSGATIAKAHVEQVVKGSRLEVVFYQVDLKMLEDISRARIGEKVLLFLYRSTLRSPSDYPEEIRKVTGESPLFLIYHLGRGRFVALTSGDKDYLCFRRGSRVILPDDLPVNWGFDSSDPDLGRVSLEDFTKYVAQQAARTGG